jgi:hypothetical protein
MRSSRTLILSSPCLVVGILVTTVLAVHATAGRSRGALGPGYSRGDRVASFIDRRRHPLFALEIRESLWAANITIASSLLGFAPIRRVKRNYYPAGLTPQRRFVAAEAIECEIRQIRQMQKAAGELDGIVSFHVTVRVSSSKQGMNNVSRI